MSALYGSRTPVTAILLICILGWIWLLKEGAIWVQSKACSSLGSIWEEKSSKLALSCIWVETAPWCIHRTS